MMDIGKLISDLIQVLLAAGLGFIIYILWLQTRISIEKIREAKLKSIRVFDVPEGKLFITDIDRHGNLRGEPYYAWPGLSDGSHDEDIEYISAERPPNAYVLNDARHLLRESMSVHGWNGVKILSINAIPNLGESRWRLAVEYLKQFGVETYPIGQSHEEGTYIGSLHHHLKELYDNVLHHRIPTPPLQGR